MDQNLINIKNQIRLEISSFKIRDSGYKTPILSMDKGIPKLEMVTINNLAEKVIDKDTIQLAINFPFKNTHYVTVISKSGNGISVRDIIEQSRSAFSRLYQSMTSFPCDIQDNKPGELYELTYPINSLIVESVYVDRDSGELNLKMEAQPKVKKDPNIPF